jgi:diguanylate cyclase (GGDEF)-like protein
VLQLQGSGREDLPVLVLSNEASPILLDGAADRTEVLPAHLPSERLLCVVATHLERGRLIRRLQEQDGLTGLLNYTAFHERARALLAGPVTRAAYLLIDVEGLARINELHGYRAGDKVLAKLAGLLRKRVRYSDVLGRLEGQHFAILLEDLGEAEAVRLADRLCAEFAKAQQVASDGSAFSARITVGVAAIDGVAATPEELAEAAASALHCSKDANRGSRAVHATAAPRPLAPLAAASSESAAAQLSAPALVGSSRAGSVRELAERPSDQSTVEEWKALAAVDGAGWGEAGRVALPR